MRTIAYFKGNVNSYNLFKMKNNFTEVMSKKTDEELIQVVTRDEQKYQEWQLKC
jgi:hypothetical protein